MSVCSYSQKCRGIGINIERQPCTGAADVAVTSAADHSNLLVVDLGHAR